jgi:hypothetical protein
MKADRTRPPTPFEMVRQIVTLFPAPLASCEYGDDFARVAFRLAGVDYFITIKQGFDVVALLRDEAAP